MPSVNSRLPSKLSGLFKLHFSHSVWKMNESTFMKLCGRLPECGKCGERGEHGEHGETMMVDRGWFNHAGFWYGSPGVLSAEALLSSVTNY